MFQRLSKFSKHSVINVPLTRRQPPILRVKENLYLFRILNYNFISQVEEEEEAAPVAVQTSFTAKLDKFDPEKKVAVIKAVKSLVEGMNLVQAKKFVEGAPAVIKADID